MAKLGIGIGWRSALAAVLAVALSAAPAQESARPNLVLIVADDLGYGDLGAYGAVDIATPQIDALARDGVRFTDGYVTAPVCAPSRAGLLAGTYPQRYGTSSDETRKPEIPLSQGLLPETLKGAGYVTGLVGKWNLTRAAAPAFDEIHDPIDWSADYWPDPQGLYGGVGGGSNFKLPQGIWGPTRPGDEFLTDRLGRQAVDFIERRAGQPFFLYVSFNAAHAPLQGKAEHRDAVAHLADEPARVYGSMRLSLDENVGRILAKLDELGLTDNTLVVFVSDNGPVVEHPIMRGWPAGWPAQTSVGSAGPLRGGKRTLWEGGIRVPFLLRWPARVAPGQVYGDPVSTLDLYPTFCGAAGAAAPAETRLDGVDLLPHLDGATAEEPPHETIFWKSGSAGAVRHGTWKLHIDPAGNRLYDLGSDLGEAVDLAEAEPQVAADLLARWLAWSEPFPVDTDGDGIPDRTDNCQRVANSIQANTDGDGEGNDCDPDDDNDGVLDLQDNCPTLVNPEQRDFDGDRLGNPCDADDDNDSVPDTRDSAPLDAAERGPVVALSLGAADPVLHGYAWGDNAYRTVLAATFQGPPRDRLLHLLGYDIDNNHEVGVWLNGKRLGYLSPGPNDGLARASLWLLPQWMQVGGVNRVELRQTTATYKWGATGLGIYELDTLWGQAQGLPGGDTAHPDGIELHLQSQPAGLLLELAGWDADRADEIALDLNGQPLADLPAGGDGAWGETHHLLLAGPRLRPGDNALWIRNRLGEAEPWAVRLVRAVPGDSPLGNRAPGQGSAERRGDGVSLLIAQSLGLNGLELAYFDADLPTEIAVSGSGGLIGYAPVAPGVWGAPVPIDLAGALPVTLRVQSTSYLPRKCSGAYGEVPSCIWGARIARWR